MTARLLIMIVSVLLYTCDELARAQGDDTRHGAWLGVGLGYGSAGFSCDTCGRSRELGGWTFNLGLGGTPNPHVQLGVQGDFWTNGLRRGKLPTINTGTVLLAYYPSVTGSTFVEAGVGLSNYALEHGTGDPLEPVSHDPAYFSGTGRGYTLGFGWEGIRVVYHYGNVGALRDPSGAMIATRVEAEDAVGGNREPCRAGVAHDHDQGFRACEDSQPRVSARRHVPRGGHIVQCTE